MSAELKKKCFQGYEIFLRWQTDPLFLNQNQRCRLKGQVSTYLFIGVLMAFVFEVKIFSEMKRK